VDTDTVKYVVVSAGDRVDTLANKYLGDPLKWDRIVKANPYMDIWSPKAGQTIVIPNAR
jgi:hypothetical protein